MATRTVITLFDDLDGSELTEGTKPTTFAIDGEQYSIDLSEHNRDALQKALEPYIEKAQRISRGRTSGGSSSGTASRGGGSVPTRNQFAEIREWARANGHAVPDRGPLKRSIIEEWQQSR